MAKAERSRQSSQLLHCRQRRVGVLTKLSATRRHSASCRNMASQATPLEEGLGAAKSRRNERGAGAASAQENEEKKKSFSLPRDVGFSTPRMHENHAWRITNAEIRMTKEARMTKLESCFGTPTGPSAFGLRHSFVIQVSLQNTSSFARCTTEISCGAPPLANSRHEATLSPKSLPVTLRSD